MLALALACSGLVFGELPPSDARHAGIRGLIYDQGRWVSPDEVIARDRGDVRQVALQDEYEARRSKADESARGQRELARWCDRVGLEAEAVAHFTAVTRFEPDDGEARKRLGHRRHRGRWMTETEVAAESTEADAQAKADREWVPKIAAWRRQLTEPEHRAEAIRGLAGIRDPRAVPALLKSFGHRVTWEQAWAIQILGRLDSPASSRVLAELAVFGIDEPVRQSALRRLSRRDPRTFVGLLINWLHEPIRYQVVPATGATATPMLRVEGESAIVERTYIATPSGGAPGSRAIGADARQSIADRQRDDARAIDRSNVTIELTNARVEGTLKAVTGADFGPDARVWSAWWTSELGYSYVSPPPPTKPVVSESVRVVYTPRPPIVIGASRHSCFAAGTPVLTRSGPRPIETLSVGDQVVSQDPASGEVAFRPILAVFHNPPAATLKVYLANDSIVATPIHRFWKAGEGWTMARDLKPGDRVRVLGEIAEVIAVARDQVQPVFNLEVAGGHSFFVGQGRALVHDNSLVSPATVAFDAGLASAGGPAR